MIIKLFDKDIDDNRFWLMIADTLDATVEGNEEFTETLALEFAESLKEDLANIIDSATADWIEENRIQE